MIRSELEQAQNQFNIPVPEMNIEKYLLTCKFPDANVTGEISSTVFQTCYPIQVSITNKVYQAMSALVPFLEASMPVELRGTTDSEVVFRY